MADGLLDEILVHAFSIDEGDRLVIPEPFVKQVLRTAGVTTPAGAIASDAGALGAAAASLRAPLVLKAFGPGIVHKSDVGAVRLGLQHEDLASAAAEMATELARHGLRSPSFYVEEQAEAGLELIIGATTNEFGTAVVVGAGGTLTELLDDVALGLAPIDHAGALELLRGFRASVLFDGHRGRPPIDREVVAQALVAIAGPDGVLARVGPRLREFEINPLIVSARGAVAADARLIVARTAAVRQRGRPPATDPTRRAASPRASGSGRCVDVSAGLRQSRARRVPRGRSHRRCVGDPPDCIRDRRSARGSIGRDGAGWRRLPSDCRARGDVCLGHS